MGCRRAGGIFHSDDIGIQRAGMLKVCPVSFPGLKRHQRMGCDEEWGGVRKKADLPWQGMGLNVQ